jgi:hypothetical protein
MRTTNGEIGYTAPHVYLNNKAIVGPEPIGSVLEEHLIVVEPFTAQVYEKFLHERASRILREISRRVAAEPVAEPG